MDGMHGDRSQTDNRKTIERKPMNTEIHCAHCGVDITKQVRDEMAAQKAQIGSRGGFARAAGLTPTERAAAARRAAKARWKAVRLQAMIPPAA